MGCHMAKLKMTFPFSRGSLGYHLPREVIYLSSVKSCRFPHIQPQLKGHDTFFQACWQPWLLNCNYYFIVVLCTITLMGFAQRPQRSELWLQASNLCLWQSYFNIISTPCYSPKWWQGVFILFYRCGLLACFSRATVI